MELLIFRGFCRFRGFPQALKEIKNPTILLTLHHHALQEPRRFGHHADGSAEIQLPA